MQKKILIVIGIIILFLGLFITPIVAIKNEENSIHSVFNGNILYVGGSGPGNYTKIQDAVNDASDYDTVFVFDDSSPYEECIDINVRISLIGESKESTIIIGDCIENLIKVDDWDVTVSGFTIKRNESKRYPYYGIYINRDRATISGNIISNIETGISVMSNYNQIIDNEFVNCGIYILYSQYYNTISNNYVNGKPLIYLNKKFNEKITNAGQVILFSCVNISIENIDISDVFYGIYLVDSRLCKILGNKITDSKIFLRDSKRNEIMGNKISLIKGRAMYTSVGITLQTSNENIISGNNIVLNQGNGIFIISSDENILTNNNINMNINGIRLDESNLNTITNNNFVGNVRNVFFLDCKGNKWNGNYWGRVRFLPKLITGSITVEPPGYHSPGKYWPWFNFDFRPAKMPIKI